MKFSRWYDKNINLANFINFVEGLPAASRAVISNNLMSILMSEMSGNLDEKLNEISNNDYSYKRWYDSNMDISNAFEIMKSMSVQEQNYIINRLMQEAVMDSLNDN